MMSMFTDKGNGIEMDEDDDKSKNSLSRYNSCILSNITEYIDILHGSNDHPSKGSVVTAPFPCKVVEVLIKEGMEIQVGQPILKVLVPSSYVPFETSSEVDKSNYKNVMEGHSRAGIYPLADVSADLNARSSRPASSINYVDIMKRYENFKRFDVVVDDSGHLFSSHRSAMQHPDWANTIKEERRILEEHLPETIFVRVYESRMDLLRAVIIGPQGTPYQDGLFFFDVFFPEDYPSCPPLVRYHSGGFAINPSIHKCGEVCLRVFTATGLPEKLWGPGANMLRLLVCIQDTILNTKPFFNGFVSASLRGSVAGEWLSLLYNENTILNSLKTMVYIMEKPPKNFEDFVVGHFRKRVCHILMACKFYTEGQPVGCLVCDINETCSSKFEKDVFLFLEPLVEAFLIIGANEAESIQYHHIMKPRFESDETFEDLLNKKRKRIDICHGLDGEYASWNVFAYRDSTVTKVLVKDGMEIEKGRPLYAGNVAMLPISSKKLQNSAVKKILDGNHRSRVGIFSMEDLLDQGDAKSSPMAGLDCEDVRKWYENFKKFKSVMDYSDHFFSSECSAINQPSKDWANKIHDEWSILEEHLPANIFVRVYESRIDLLRAVIIGLEGTPYHGGLFFFDMCFPSNYPNSPPLVHYHSGGFGINPNLYKCGKVRLSLPKTNGGQEMMWVPGTSTMFQLLVSIQNQILNAEPLFNDLTYALMRDTRFGVACSYLYNETILIKSLKTMVYTINKPPKNFEDFVVGHFRNRARDILRVACGKKIGSITIKNDLLSFAKTLLDAFTKIGTKRNELLSKEKE